MRNLLLGGVAIASAFAFMVPSAPASAQGACQSGQPCYRPAGVGQTPYQHPRPHYGRGYDNGIGVGVGAALATGVIIGGAMQQNQGYYPADADPVYSDQGPGDYDAGPQVAEDGDTTAYCMRTYRSYDLRSGTYLGYDGLRHPCP